MRVKFSGLATASLIFSIRSKLGRVEEASPDVYGSFTVDHIAGEVTSGQAKRD